MTAPPSAVRVARRAVVDPAREATVYLLPLILLLPGCVLKTSLAKKPVAAIAVELTQGVCPGTESPLIVRARLDDGSELVTTGAGEGKVAWKAFEITASAGTVDAGTFRAASDPRATWGQPVTLRVVPIGHEDKAWEGQVPVRYDCAYVADFSGEDGRDGVSGTPGAAGRDGRDEQSSESYAAPGGHGEHGGNGGHGGEGESGRHAGDVQVRVAQAAGPAGERLLQVEVRDVDTGRVALYALDTRGGSLTVWATGGVGGRGGDGGVGGQGGHGGTGAPPGNGGNGGDGGDGGSGGDGGDGGKIKVIADPQTREALSAVLALHNGGGSGGSPGSAGGGGSGGYTYSGAVQGESGRSGRTGDRSGRDGRGGPAPTFEYLDVPELW